MHTKQCKLCDGEFKPGQSRQVYCYDCLDFPKSGKVMVYGLQDRREGIVRYVGSTCSPVSRFMNHRSNCDAKGNPALSSWRYAIGDRLQMIILKVVDKSQGRREEEVAIRKHGRNGLLNGRAAKQRIYTQAQAHEILTRWLK